METSSNLPHPRHWLMIRGLVLCLPIALMPALAAAQAPLTFRAAVQRAVAVNPTVAAARLRRPIGIASRDVAKERLNPEFRFEASKETPKEAYTFAVPLELGGKRERRIAVADASIASADAELNQAIVQVEADVRRAYFARIVAERRLALFEEVRTLAQRAVDAATARYDEGGSPRLEVVQTQLALADADNQTTGARGTVSAARVSLNVLLGYAIDAPTPLDTSLDVDPAMPLDTVLARARSANADLLVIDRRMDEARARLALAHALRTPDLTPEGSLTRRSEPEFDVGWRAALAVSVPLFTTHAAGVRVEEATIAQLQSEREATLAHVSGEVTAASAIVDAQREQYVRYRDQIVPQALQVERMAEDSYRLGQTPIAAYLQALQSSRDVRLRSIQAMADLQNALADLERAVGAPLDPTAVADASPSASLTLRSAGTSAPATTAVSSAATVARP